MSTAIAAGDPRERLHGEALLVRTASRALSRAWATGVASKPALDPELLIQKAQRREQAELAGGHWQEALGILADDLQREARLGHRGTS